jgi:hypothetical protein
MSEFRYPLRAATSDGGEQMQQRTMGKWDAWLKELREKGHLKASAGPPPSHVIEKRKRQTLFDKPRSQGKDWVAGYVVIEAESLAQAVALATECPILESGGSVEVRRVQIADPQWS